MSSLIGNRPNQIPTNADLGRLAFLNTLPPTTASLSISSSLVVPTTSTLPVTPAQGNLRFNTTTLKFEGYNGTLWGAIAGGGGSGLTATAIKTSAYTAAANELVRCNTTAGAFSVTLPASPTDGDLVGIIDAYNTFTTYNLTVLPNGKTIESDSTSLILDVSGTFVSLIYISATNNWKIESTPNPSSPYAAASTSVLGLVKVDGTTITVNGSGVISASASATKTISNKTSAYTVVAGDLGTIINCTAVITVNLTSAATLGAGFACTIWNEYTGSNASNVTIDPYLTETIDGQTTIVLGISEGVEIISDGTNWVLGAQRSIRGFAENNKIGALRPVASGNSALAIGAGALSQTEGSIAIGGNTVQSSRPVASGLAAIAIGARAGGAAATGSHSIAIGAASSGDPTASSSSAIAIGTNSGGTGSQAVTGAGAVAIGGSYASGTDSFAAAIANNTSTYGARGANSVAIGQQSKATGVPSIAMGQSANATGNGSVAIGVNASATAGNSVSLGIGATAQGFSSLALGTSTYANAANSVAMGSNAKSDIIGKFTYASSLFQQYGDAQFGKIVLRADTSTTTAVVLTSDGAAASITNQLIVATGQAMTFQGMLIGKQPGSGTIASYIFKGAIVNHAGTITLSTISVDTMIDNIGLASGPTFTADTTNKALAVTSGAKAATNIRWVCNIDSVEVTYA